jgi:hypothetical protein
MNNQRQSDDHTERNGKKEMERFRVGDIVMIVQIEGNMKRQRGGEMSRNRETERQRDRVER